LKWGEHPCGEERTVASASEFERTVTLLLSGEFQVDFPELRKRAILNSPGDYVVFGPGVMHTWKVLSDCRVLTIRWPSECRAVALARGSSILGDI